jgi:hypothetical protein
MKELQKNHQMENGEKLKERSRDFYQKNRTRALLETRVRKLKREYQLTLEEFAVMEKAQGGRCLICNNPPPEGKNLYVDHCHTTGKVRGLLCMKCNAGLGMFRDNLELLKSAMGYLTRS